MRVTVQAAQVEGMSTTEKGERENSCSNLNPKPTTLHIAEGNICISEAAVG